MQRLRPMPGVVPALDVCLAPACGLVCCSCVARLPVCLPVALASLHWVPRHPALYRQLVAAPSLRFSKHFKGFTALAAAKLTTAAELGLQQYERRVAEHRELLEALNVVCVAVMRPQWSAACVWVSGASIWLCHPKEAPSCAVGVASHSRVQGRETTRDTSMQLIDQFLAEKDKVGHTMIPPPSAPRGTNAQAMANISLQSGSVLSARLETLRAALQELKEKLLELEIDLVSNTEVCMWPCCRNDCLSD